MAPYGAFSAPKLVHFLHPNRLCTTCLIILMITLMSTQPPLHGAVQHHHLASTSPPPHPPTLPRPHQHASRRGNPGRVEGSSHPLHPLRLRPSGGTLAVRRAQRSELCSTSRWPSCRARRAVGAWCNPAQSSRCGSTSTSRRGTRSSPVTNSPAP